MCSIAGNQWAVGPYRAMVEMQRGEEMLKQFHAIALFHFPSID
jgi:hypothetical protein